MERLTYTSLLGNRVSRGGCKDVKCGTGCDACGIYKIICKLWEYEETGLTPEQVAAMKQELIDERYRHDRLQDFEVAEAQELARVKAELADLKELWDVLPLYTRHLAVEVRDSLKKSRESDRDICALIKEE